MIPFEQHPLLSSIPGLRHGFFGRRGGQSTGDFASLNVSENVGDRPAAVTANRAAVLDALQLPSMTVAQLTQVHSARVVTLTDPHEAATRPEADGIVTATPDVLLAIQTADCAPILLADSEAGVVGAAHAGWRGALSGVVAATVEAMRRLGARPASMVAVIGPTIALENYEVGPDFAANLVSLHPEAASRISTPAGGREHFDLPGYVVDQLTAAGVANIASLGRCTYANPVHYFSHRRATHEGRKAGRQASLIGLV